MSAPNSQTRPAAALSKMQSVLRRATAMLTPSSSSTSLSKSPSSSFSKAPTTTSLFPQVDPAVDGEECLQDCATCTVAYPKKFSIDQSDTLYGHIKGFSTHVIVATGKTDWVRDVTDEKGSVMEAVGRHGTNLQNGRCMLSASNMPIPGDGADTGILDADKAGSGGTDVLILPSWRIWHGIRPRDVPELLDGVVGKGETTTTRCETDRPEERPPEEKLVKRLPATPPEEEEEEEAPSANVPRQNNEVDGESGTPPLLPADDGDDGHEPEINKLTLQPALPFTHRFHSTACPHAALILLCSQKTRDARCGQSAPLLRREFERHLRPLGLHRDAHDTRPGGVGIYFVSHVGGHKYSANVLVYRTRRIGRVVGQGGNMAGGGDGYDGDKTSSPVIVDEADEAGGAVQCIWLARVRPEDCEPIVKYTVLQGKVVKPARQLRGGFDRERGLVSW